MRTPGGFREKPPGVLCVINRFARGQKDTFSIGAFDGLTVAPKTEAGVMIRS